MAARSEVWDRAAQAYARQEHLERQAVCRALAYLAPGTEERLLDVATGTGVVLRELASRPGRPAQAVGLDGSEEMLARIGPLPVGWRTVLGDATALAFDAASFDIATAAYLLQVLEPHERSAALHELHRVVRPGGRLAVVTTWSPRPALRAVLAALARAAPASLIGLRPHDPRADLAASGWRLERVAILRGGYPSLVALARRG